MFVLSIFVVVAICHCCKQRRKQKQRKPHKNCEDIETSVPNEKTKLSNSYENSELLDSKMNTGETDTFLNENLEIKSLSCPDLPQQFIPSKQPHTKPEERSREEELTYPVQPESSIENGHDTYRKTSPDDTYRAVVSSSDTRLRFPEQQATNNEQDLAQKMAISSDDINRDDIA